METIINHQELNFLKYNNSFTICKKITNEMIISPNKILINIDLPNDKINCLYWKFHNINAKINGIGVSKNFCVDKLLREPLYFTTIQPYQHLLHLINDNFGKNDYIYMYSYSLYCCHDIFVYDTYAKIDVLSFEVQFENELKLNGNEFIELVVQIQLNPNNLPNDLEILEIRNLSMIFENLPTSLKIIKIIEDYTDLEIKKYFPKIPFGCKVINHLGKELEL